MKNFRINADRKYVDIIINGLEKKNGHCPCRLEVSDATLCPCDEFIKDGICKCRLYVPLNDDSAKSEDDDGKDEKDTGKE